MFAEHREALTQDLRNRELEIKKAQREADEFLEKMNVLYNEFVYLEDNKLQINKTHGGIMIGERNKEFLYHYGIRKIQDHYELTLYNKSIKPVVCAMHKGLTLEEVKTIIGGTCSQ